jgi:hypothetical protein
VRPPEPDRAGEESGARGKQIASARSGQRTSRVPKSLRKQVQFAELTDSRTNVREHPGRPMRICKELQTSVKSVGAIQVFCPRTSTKDLNAGKYRLSRIIDSVSLCQNPYSGRQIPRFQVATAYKTKANKVRPVDPNGTNSSKPKGCLD